ncbi:MAG: hypothetical protein U1E35_05740 [Rhodospirillales bacterium]
MPSVWCMMAPRACTPNSRRAGDRDHRHVFGSGAGNAVDGTEFADAEGGDQRAEAVDAGVAVAA